MKKFIYPIFILFIVSCNNDNKKTIEELINEGNLEELQERRSSLIIQKGQINNELKEITEGVSILDTAKSFVLVNTVTTKTETINQIGRAHV